VFVNRQQAAERLAKAISELNLSDVVLFALPRGGVVLGAELSQQLRAPLGLLFVSKIGHPLNPEYAIGAVAEDDEPLYNPIEAHGAKPEQLRELATAARSKIAHQRLLYCGENIVTPLSKEHSAVIIDDGIATGLTMAAAVNAARNSGAKQVIAAAPVASAESLNLVGEFADKTLVLEPPEDFKGSISAHYRQFEQVNDKEVKKLLAQSFINLCNAVT
jgi:putative phosphoribosyl transferase